MKKRFTILTLSILSYSLGSCFSRINLFSSYDFSETYFKDTESIIAIGEKFSLMNSSLSDLIMISGISDRIALDILKRKSQVIGIAIDKPESSKHTALEVVKGIGPKKAILLGSYVDLRP